MQMVLEGLEIYLVYAAINCLPFLSCMHLLHPNVVYPAKEPMEQNSKFL